MIFAAFLARRAARRYANRLPGSLRKDYGAREFYTPAQIAAAVKRARLPEQYLSIAYAAFLDEATFNQLGFEGDYRSLRALFQRNIRTAPAYGVESVTQEYTGVGGAGLD
jgi:hypothetical protein